MRLIKPLWLKHSGEKRDLEVYSCSVSSDGKRLVTAGGDGYVRIWSTEAIAKGTDLGFTGPKQLAALSNHSGTIHAVRFSPNNRFLASGADDRLACVYWLDPSAPAHSTFGSNEAPPVENWRIHRRLAGHDNDVQDLAWAPDSSILVTVGLDSKVVVWSGHTFEKLKTLAYHSSQVKGICFDPANKYFATASDDRTVRIFSYTPPERNATQIDQSNNFILEATVSDSFTTSPLTTYFRRLSWSPDGANIVAANATNGPVSTASIIDRSTWQYSNSLIGHEGPLEVCAFSPRLYSEAEAPEDQMDGAELTVVACAGQDRALTCWSTMAPKPLFVIENITTKAISDITWAPDGQALFFCSLDGTIACMDFGRGELGYALSLDTNISSLKKFGGSGKLAMVEGPDGQLLEEQSREDEMRNVQGRMGALMGDGPSTSETGFSVLANGAAHTNGTVNGDAVKSSNGIDKTLTNGHNTEDPRIDRLKNRVTITQDGKKRVAPILVSDTAGRTQSSLPQTQLLSTQHHSTQREAPQNILDLSKPFDGFPKGGLTSMLLGNKRKLAETGIDDDDATALYLTYAQQEGVAPILLNTTEGLSVPADAVSRPSDISSALAVSQTRLAVPDVRPSFQQPSIATAATNAPVPTMTVRNSLGQSRGGIRDAREPSRIVVAKGTAQLWQDYLPRAVSLVTANQKFWAAACEDGTLHVWSPAGRRLFNAFALEAQISILDCRGPWLLAITAVGICHIWNIERSSAPHPPVSLGPVLELASHAQGPHLIGGPGIIFARLNSEGRVVLAMSNGDAFVYSHSMYTWQRLSEAWWAVGSQYWNSSDAALTSSSMAGGSAKDEEKDDVVRPENISAGIIAVLERNTNAQTQLRGRAYHLQRLIKVLISAEGYEGLESSVSVAHLENRVAAALTLGAKDEFRVYLGMYAKRLGQENARLKIEELLRSLLRGVYPDGNEKDDEPFPGRGADVEGGAEELCGWKKRTLLREVVLILGKYRDLQRITVQYARLLGLTSDAADAVMMEI